MNTKQKSKFRIKTKIINLNGDPDTRYHVQRKLLFFWITIATFFLELNAVNCLDRLRKYE